MISHFHEATFNIRKSQITFSLDYNKVGGTLETGC